MKKSKGILFFNNWFDLMIDVLNPEQTIELLKIIRAKKDGDIYKSYDAEVNAHWFHMQHNVESSMEKYEELCAKRKEYGSRGGAPKGNNNASKNKQNNQKQAKQPMDKEKDKDKETYPSDKEVSPTHPLVDVSVTPQEAFDELFRN
jgi:hypothetical protein